VLRRGFAAPQHKQQSPGAIIGDHAVTRRDGGSACLWLPCRQRHHGRRHLGRWWGHLSRRWGHLSRWWGHLSRRWRHLRGWWHSGRWGHLRGERDERRDSRRRLWKRGWTHCRGRRHWCHRWFGARHRPQGCRRRSAGCGVYCLWCSGALRGGGCRAGCVGCASRCCRLRRHDRSRRRRLWFLPTTRRQRQNQHATPERYARLHQQFP
jgi:hypothetical protein